VEIESRDCTEARGSACGTGQEQAQAPKGGLRRKTSRRTTSFGPADVFWASYTAGQDIDHRRGLVANGFG
jgi:hypothetical protein